MGGGRRNTTFGQEDQGVVPHTQKKHGLIIGFTFSRTKMAWVLG